MALARVHEVHMKHTAFGYPDDGFAGASPVCWLFAVSGSQSTALELCGWQCRSRLPSHSKIELHSRELLVGFGDTQPDAAESFSLLLVFLG